MTAEPKNRQYKDMGPLADLLIKACPPNEKGVKSIPILARRLGLAPFSLYKWIRDVKIPPDRVVQVVGVSEGRVRTEDFVPYVFK